MNDENKVKIYSFYYKPNSVLTINNCIIPVWAGKNNRKPAHGLIGDDTGENISHKNQYFSELSGIFWVWKNTQSELVGSCHYRRYFTNSKEPFIYRLKRQSYFFAGLKKKRHGLIYTNNIKFWKSKILKANEVLEILCNYDVILPERRKLRQSIRLHYCKYHNPNDLIIIGNILKEKYSEYLSSFENFLNGNRLFANNMFVMNWENFDKMMHWLFSILFEFENQIDLDNYQGYQKRIFGFISERLISLYIFHNELNYKELPLVYFKNLKYK
jgi:hypothetical protein